MKKIFILFFVLSLAFSQAFAQYGDQFANRGFEEWANFGSSSSSYEPVHWHSTMSASGTFSGFLSKQIEASSQVRTGSAGQKSVRIWPNSVLGVTANGNLTNGRMNAGSMSATGSGNYNYTQRSDERFNTPMNVCPDSISVWVCFRSASASQNAQIHAAVHGDADYKFLANGTEEPEDKLVATAMTEFQRTAQAGGDMIWRRISVPFQKNGPCNDVKYLLFTITTNATPGQGSTDDDMFIDDILLIYNPSLQTAPLPSLQYEAGETMTVSFTMTGTMSAENLNAAPNQIVAQLSDSQGGFSNPTELGRVVANQSGSMVVTLPDNAEGNHYRVRVVSTNYPMIAADNGADIWIRNSHSVNEMTQPNCNVFPNPVTDVLHVVSSEKILSLSIYNANGMLVFSNETAEKSFDLPIDGLAKGVYFVKITTESGIIVKKVTVW